MRTFITRRVARAAGLKRYFTGKPCKYGHVAERLVSSRTCADCIDKDKRAKTAAALYLRKKDEIDARNAEYQRAHPKESRRRQKSFWDRNPHKRNAHRAKYRAAILRAIPPWANFSAMVEIYEEAARLTRETGIPHEVDHVVPLQSAWVCGLHCEANLKVDTAENNRRKSNKLWPDMPDFLHSTYLEKVAA